MPAAKIRILSDIFIIFAGWTKHKKTTAIKRAVKIIWRIIVAFATLLFAVALVIQLPQVQTFVTGKVTDRLSEKLDGNIVFEKIHLKPFTTLVLKNVAILDKTPVQDPLDPSGMKVDTLFRAGYIIARFSLDGLVRNEGFHLDKAYVSDAQMTLVIEDNHDTPTSKNTTDNLSRIFRLKKSENPKKSDKEIFHIRKVEIMDMGFAMKNYTSDRPTYEGGIDWNDMDITDIDLNARNLRFKGGIMSGNLEKLSFREKSGYQVEDLTGSAKVGRGKTIVEDLHIDDLWSDVHLNLFMMSYENVKAFKNFIDNVKIDGDIAPSLLDFETISYFAPELKGNRLKADIEGKMSGPVSDFTFSDIRMTSSTGGFAGTASGRMSGIPDMERTRLEATLNDFAITSDGLGSFVNEWMTGKGKLDLGKFAKGMTFTVDATASGLLNHLDITADIRPQSGELEAHIRLDDILVPGKAIGISGTLSTGDLDIGHIIGTDLLGPVTLNAGVDAKIGSKSTPTTVRIDSLNIRRIHANGYDYSNIAGVGDFADNSFNGRITGNDPNLNFMFQGTFALSAKTNNARYKFLALIGHADLNAMNLDKRGKSIMSLTASADFTKTAVGDLRGTIGIGDLKLENSSGRYDIGDINLSSYSADNRYVIKLDSDFADGKYSGTAPVTTFVTDLKEITVKKEMPALLGDSTYVWNGENYELNFRCSNSMDILSFIMPGLYIDEGTAFDAKLTGDGTFNAELKSDRLAFGKNYLKDIDASFGNGDDSLNLEVRCSEIKASPLTLKDNSVILKGSDNHLGMLFSYNNPGETVNRGNFRLRADLSHDGEALRTDIDIMPSYLYLHSKKWDLTPSHITVMNGGMDVTHFGAASGKGSITMTGRLSKEQSDTMSLHLGNFDLSMLNSLMTVDFGIMGTADGDVRLISPVSSAGILADLVCDSTFIASTPLGTISVGSRWNNETKKFGIYARNEINGKSTFNVNGTLAPKGNVLDMKAGLDHLKIDCFQPFLTDIFSNMEGEVSGAFKVKGPVGNLAISSNMARLDNAMLKVDYTNVPYYAEGPFHADESGVYFDSISIRDRQTGTGTLTGSINWDHFRDISFNTHINVNGIEGVNITEDTGLGFYGHIYGTGNVSITGPISSILLSVDAVTAKTGQLHVPLSGASTAGKVTDLLRFTEEKTEKRIDPYEQMMTRLDKTKKTDSDFTVKLRVNAQPEVEAFIEIDKASGNILTGHGSGLIDLEASADRFLINGDYTLTGGNYKFVALGLVSRDFQIQDGSSIRFNGDIMESTLDINASYRTKASLSTLLSDVSSVSNKRAVDCMISISDKLNNPRLSFGIEIPDLSPMYKSRVESALSTEDKLQKQFLSLIVSNNFLPDEQSGIVNNSSVLYSNVTEMFANQLNNIFQKLDIPLDLGLNYQPNEQGNDLFDVAVSTQLFNNRVVVNGNIGNRQYTTGGLQNDVVGDLDIEIKLDRSGSFRLNLFSHSADQFSNYLDNSQRNGVGIMYQTEFNNFGKFLRSIFMRKKDRQNARLKEEQAMIEGGKNIILIEEPSGQTETKETDD